MDEIFSDVQTLLSIEFEDLHNTSFPNDAPPEFPRFTAKSHDGFSQINISLNQVIIEVSFEDKNFSSNKFIYKYMKNKLDLGYEITKLITNNIIFSGTSLTVIEDNKKKIKDFSKKHNNNANIFCTTELYEYMHRYSFITNKYHYLNITISNPMVNFALRNKVDDIEQVKYTNALLIEIDVNDRHGYNYLKKYNTTKIELLKNLEIIENTIQSKLEGILIGKDN